MTRATFAREAPGWALIVAMFTLAAIAWNRVPDRVPTHWDITGQPDGWGSRFVGLLLLPIVAAAVHGLIGAVARLRSRADFARISGHLAFFRTAVVLVLGGVYFATVLHMLGWPVPTGVLMPLLLAFLFVVTGVFVATVPDEAVSPPPAPGQADRLRAGRRVAGAIIGLAALPLALIGFTGRPWLIAAALACVLTGVIVLVVHTVRASAPTP